jgi:hypothetical protein
MIERLAAYDVRRNPKLTTLAGLERWAEGHPNRLYAWQDVNNDGIADALGGWDSNADGKLNNDEISHVNGYYLRKSDWPYRMRYNADKVANPDLFENGKMPMSRYVRQLYGADIDPRTGAITYEDDPDRIAWEKNLRAHHYKIKKPAKQLTHMNLWRMWCFKPVYDCFVSRGGDSKNAPVMSGSIPLKHEKAFKSLLVGQKAYKMIFTDWLISEYRKQHGNLTQAQVDIIKTQKEFKEQIKSAVEIRLEHLPGAWYEVFNFLCAAVEDIVGIDSSAFQYNYNAIHARYLELLTQFNTLEGPQKLSYIDTTLDYNQPDLWVPQGFTPARSLTAEEQAWNDENKLAAIMKRAQLNDAQAQQFRQQTLSDWSSGRSSARSSARSSREMSPDLPGRDAQLERPGGRRTLRMLDTSVNAGGP